MSGILEKLAWAAIPLAISATTYLWTTTQQNREQIQALKLETELAREKLRQDVLSYAAANRERIAVLEERLRKLESGK